MAYPRIFLSSPYYGLQEVRKTVGSFIRDSCYEVVMSERSQIPYGIKNSLQEDCYEEIRFCDILVSIIGSRFGSSASESDDSVSQMEVRCALKEDIPIYVFVEKNVHAEYSTYLKNKDQPNLSFAHVDDSRIFRFIEELHGQNIPTFPFVHASDITDTLQKQLAGLLHSYLQGRKQKSDSLTSPTSISKVEASTTISTAYYRLQELLQLPSPLLFTNLSELNRLLAALGYTSIDSVPWESELEWVRDEQGSQSVLRVSKQIFQDAQWQDDFIALEHWEVECKKSPDPH